VVAGSVASALKHLTSLRLLQVGLRARKVCESKACHFCVLGSGQPSWQASTEREIEEEGSGEEERGKKHDGFGHSQDKISQCSSRRPGG